MNSPKITIITAVKNGMPYIYSCLKSIQLQTYKNIEIVLVYSHSSDQTLKVLDKYQNLNNVKIVIDNKSTNKFGSFNKGIEISTGDLVGFLHADDFFYDENVLKKISEFYKLANFDLVYGNILFCDRKNIFKIKREWISSKFNQIKLYFGWMPPHVTIFMKSEIIKNYLYLEKYEVSGDYFYILNLLHKTNLKIKFLNEYITVMREGGHSTNVKLLKKKLIEDLNISFNFFKFIFPLTILLKILQKIPQFFTRKKIVKNNYTSQLNV